VAQKSHLGKPDSKYRLTRTGCYTRWDILLRHGKFGLEPDRTSKRSFAQMLVKQGTSTQESKY